MSKYFTYTILESKPLIEGAHFILNLPVKKHKGFDRKKALAQLALQNPKCPCCGIVGTKFCLGQDKAGGEHWDLYSDEDYAFTIDHILPKADGGTNHISNLQIMCLECNNLKLHYPERIVGYMKLLNLLKDTDSKVSVKIQKVPYLRIDYWKRLSGDIFSQIEEFFIEDSLFDEDCGWLWFYNFRH